MKIKILPSASNDLVEGFGFYEKQSNGLGDSLFAVYYKIKKGQDNLSIFKNLLKYCHDNKKQVCNSFTYFRG